MLGEGDASDFQIQRTDANALAAKIYKQFGGLAIPWKNDPIGESFDLSLEFRISGDLAAWIVMPSEFGKPASQHFFDRDDGDCLGSAGYFEAPREALAGG